MSKELTTQVVSNIEQDIIAAEREIDTAIVEEGETWVTYALQLERIKKDFERAKKKGKAVWDEQLHGVLQFGSGKV